MKIVIAGCGWLGMSLAEELLRRGDRVVGVRRTAETARELAAAGIEPLALDLARPSSARGLPRDADAVIACQAAGGRTDDAYRRAYLDVTATLLAFARERPLRGFVYTGSTGVFGQRDGTIVDEQTPVAPAGTAATVLAQAEEQVFDAARENGLSARIVRLSGLYGPGRYGVIERVHSGRLALGPGDDAWMNFCHRSDATRTVLAALDRGRDGAVYHGSDACPVRRRELVHWIAERLNIEPPRMSEDARSSRSGRKGGNRRVSSERTRAELSVELRYPSVREGLAEALPGISPR